MINQEHYRVSVSEESLVFPVVCNNIAPMHIGLDYSIQLVDHSAIYEGDLEVTPSPDTQVLSTQGKTLSGDVIINPIPSNYGLITWNGSVLTVT